MDAQPEDEPRWLLALAVAMLACALVAGYLMTS